MKDNLIFLPSKINPYSNRIALYIETISVFIISIPILYMSPLLLDLYFRDKRNKKPIFDLVTFFYNDNDYTNIVILISLGTIASTIGYILFKALQKEISKIEFQFNSKTLAITYVKLISGKEEIIHVPFNRLSSVIQKQKNLKVGIRKL
jgi:hypothetical protein